MNLTATIIDLSTPAMRLFDLFGERWCGAMGGGYWGGGFGGFWMIASILFWIGILALAAIVISRLFARRGEAMAGGGSRTPKEILDRRYAAGEITDKEYLKIKKDLSQK